MRENLEKHIQSLISTESFDGLGINFIGMGDDKVVFETLGSKKKVIKVSLQALKEKVLLLLSDTNYQEQDEHTLQKEDLKEYRGHEDEARDIFGSEHLLKTGVFRIKIPLTKDFLLAFVDKELKPLVEKLPNDAIQEVEMLAETQIKAEELNDKEKFSTIDFSTDVITDKDFYDSENIEAALLKVRDMVNDEFLNSFQEILKDERYVPIIKDLVERIIEYTKKTGLMLDLFGPNNITIFTKEDGSIDYHLVDIVLPSSQNWSKNIKDDEKMGFLRHYYTFYYSIKSIGDMLGIEDNLKLDDLIYFKDADIPSGAFPWQVLNNDGLI